MINDSLCNHHQKSLFASAPSLLSHLFAVPLRVTLNLVKNDHEKSFLLQLFAAVLQLVLNLVVTHLQQLRLKIPKQAQCGLDQEHLPIQ
jgi:hypothetical protein